MTEATALAPDDLHPAIAHLAFLLGEWTGTGEGHYPSIDGFTFNEVATYTHVGKPFVAYSQRTKDASSGLPLHAEQGYLRPVGDTALELVIVQPTGIVEVHQGTVEGTQLRFEATDVLTTPTAVEVSSVERLIAVEKNTMNWSLAMGATGHSHQSHLQASLRRSQ